MPRTYQNVTNFAKGELSELVEGRIDLDQYYSGAKTIENMLIMEQGPAQRRPGTRFVAIVKTPSLVTRIVRYAASKTASYALEFGEGYIRFYKNNARLENPPGTPIEISSPYVAGDLDTLNFSQLNDVLFVTSTFYAPRRLERYSDTVWQLRLEPLAPGPSFEYGTRPAATLTPSATSGAGVTFTASVAQFEASDVGRELLVIAGANIGARALITGYTSQTVVTGTVTQNFINVTATAATDWKITDSYQTAITPSAVGPVGATITLTLVAAGWRVGDVGKFVQLNGGIAEITGITSNLIVNAIIRSVLNTASAASANAWTLEELAWSAANGFPTCDEFLDGRHYYAGSLAQPQTFWGSKVDDIGNFAVGVLADDAVQYTISNNQSNPIVWMRASRQLLIGTTNGEFNAFGSQDQIITPTNINVKPQTANGSTDDVQPLLVGSVVLYVTASTRRLREEVFDYRIDGYASADIIVLAQHLTRDFGLRELSYQREPTALIWSPRDDGTLLAATYIRDQNVIAWTRQITGAAVADPAVPLHSKPSDGFFESLCVIPHPNQDRDQAWVIVRRTINGATTRYVEFFDDARFYYRQLHTDCATTYDGTGTVALQMSATSGAGVTATAGAPFFVASDVGREIRIIGAGARATVTGFTSSTVVTVTIVNTFPNVGPFATGAWGVARSDLTGLSYLEGKTVQIVKDGAPLPMAVVAAGVATASEKGIKMEVGLQYISTLDPVRPEFAGPTGSIQGLPKHQPIVNVRLFESVGFTIQNTDLEDFRNEGDVQDAPPTLFTGDRQITGLQGWDIDGRVRIQQTQPLPLTVTLLNTVTDVSV